MKFLLLASIAHLAAASPLLEVLDPVLDPSLPCGICTHTFPHDMPMYPKRVI
jgi:hypothetical protein